jgi:glycosyltransferase involved in cell wall biosynthesis
MDLAKSYGKQSVTTMKKILYLRTDICDKELVAGGSVTHTLGVINGFLGHGYEIVCASSCMQKLLQKQKLEFYPLNNPRFLSFVRWKLNSFLSSIFFTLQVLRLCKHHSFDFIYQRYSILNCTGILISKFKNIPLVLEYNGSEVWISKHWNKRTMFNLRHLIRWIETINIKHAHHIVVVSQALKHELIHRGINAENILVNPNGVDPASYNPAILDEKRKLLRKKLAFDDKFVFGFIGTFHRWHGINILEHIIPEIIKQKPNAHFLLIGDGPLLFHIQATLAQETDNVTFIGTLHFEQASAYLSACDAFLCPTQPNPDGSPFFGSPTKIFEYMSLAKPIIASDLEQLSEIIAPALKKDSLNKKITKQAGILIAPDDIKGFIDAACFLMETPENNRTYLGAQAREKILENYTWQQHTKKIINHLRVE